MSTGVPNTEISWQLDSRTRTFVLFGLGWATVGFWPSLLLTVVGPGIAARYWVDHTPTSVFQQRLQELLSEKTP